jgi:hypothetical protein
MFSDLKYRLKVLTRITMIGESENVAKKAVAEASINGSFLRRRMKALRNTSGIRFRRTIMLVTSGVIRLCARVHTLKIAMDAYTSY